MDCPCRGHDEMCPCQNKPQSSEPFITKCFICEARIDTREADEGGVDIDFFQIEEGKFVCSETCLDQHENDADRIAGHA